MGSEVIAHRAAQPVVVFDQQDAHFAPLYANPDRFASEST
jgi:hypothetical protein